MRQAAVVVTAASIHPDAAALLANYRLIYADVRASEEDLVTLCTAEQPEAIMVRYGSISERVISASRCLRVIAKHGVGTDNIDKEAAARLGIPVTAALGSNSQAVAEHTLGLMFACARKLTWLDVRMKQGHWDKDNYIGLELSGLNLGLIGAGSIGLRVARVAHAIGMNVLVADPYARPGDLPPNVELTDIDSLVANADVVSLHCPLTPETRNVLNAHRLSKLKDNCIVLNTARAGLMDEQALIRELQTGRLHAAIDCFEEEPPTGESAWLTAANTVLTPHIGGTTTTAFRAMGVQAAESILSHLKNQETKKYSSVV